MKSVDPSLIFFDLLKNQKFTDLKIKTLKKREFFSIDDL
jgi:hypothetical protein